MCECCGISVVCKWFNGRNAEEMSDVELTQTGAATPVSGIQSSVEGYDPTHPLDVTGQVPGRIEDQSSLARWLRDNARMGTHDTPIAPVPVPVNIPPRRVSTLRPAAAVIPDVPAPGMPTTGRPLAVIPEEGEPGGLDPGLLDEDEDELLRVVTELNSEMFSLSFESDDDDEEDEEAAVGEAGAEEQTPADEVEYVGVVAVDGFEEDADEEEGQVGDVMVVDHTTPDAHIYHLNSGAGRFFLDLIRRAFEMPLDTPAERMRIFLENNSNILRHLVTGTVPHPRHYLHGDDKNLHETQMTPAGVAAGRQLILNISSLDWNSPRIEGVMDELCDDADGTGIRVKEFLRKHFKGQRSPKAIVYLRRTNEMFRNDDDLFKYMKKVAQKRRGKSKLNQELVRVTELSDTESDNGEGSSKPA